MRPATPGARPAVEARAGAGGRDPGLVPPSDARSDRDGDYDGRDARITRRAPDPVLVDDVRTRLARQGAPPTEADVTAAVRAAGSVLGSRALAELGAAVRAEVLGAGPLQPFLDDPAVTDVLVNAPDEVWVERAGRLERVAVDLGTTAQVRELAVRLAAAGGQRLDDARPTVDARLPDGTRLHAVLPPIAGACTLLSLRALRQRAFTLEELVAAGGVAPGLAPVLRALVAARVSFLVSGATGSGKTTLLSALLSLAPADERIVCIEESGELAPAHPHVVRLLARAANVDGAGDIGLAELVRQALRMRPDRIVLGECRGAEVREVLAALNTGHDGGCATVHANTAADVPARLEALAALAGMDRATLAAQAASALEAVLHLRRDHGRRYVAEIAVVRRDRSGALMVETALSVSPGGVPTQASGWEALARRLGA
ncbi:TadA family conjugal transfer-associated ATPase [Cellulomonas chengniuliangii]|uniref:TadA family conjugal transfer-associated ATPase n=1 Tax=Cellulomonas chengniuliangii TaxID=2968084 RepID=A0ABY5KX16_9CELL|nr:TadA family conjugal transfer-associated ATPase [Cellulomonas chengniuliangii]MCC2309482.1 TadA family conjugal transfer-associated ATPase [Cellulomonas chengniuliangii]UUI74959.1 TadA family conjugal transfer-associated ATPase [Cellulomonas chengniuliangii]